MCQTSVKVPLTLNVSCNLGIEVLDSVLEFKHIIIDLIAEFAHFFDFLSRLLYLLKRGTCRQVANLGVGNL